MRRIGLIWIAAASLVGCGDDAASADGDAGGSTGVDETGDEGGSEGSDDPSGPCVAHADCDDDNPCSVDRCEAGTCTWEVATPVTNECRPVIDVDFPPRGATVAGMASKPSVTVTGSVRTGFGEVTSLTLNGEAVEIGPDGSFAHEIPATVGGNMLVFEATDEAGRSRRRVQSFLWSTQFYAPTEPKQGIADAGLSIYMSQETLDDGDRSAPADDLATLLGLVLDSFDPAVVINPNQAIAHQAAYDIFITDMDMGGSSLSLTGIDGGMRLQASIDDVVGDLDFDCTSWECELAGGDGTGGFSIATVHLEGDLLIGTDPDHRLTATVANVNATVNPNDVDVWADNAWTNFLLSIAELFIKNNVVADLEAALESNVEAQLGPALADALGGLALATTFEFPNLGDSMMPIVVDLVADFDSTDFHDGMAPPQPSPPQGGALFLRGGGYTAQVVTPYDNLGVPARVRCGSGEQTIVVPRTAPLEIALGDDLLNELLYAGWRGGLLELHLMDATSDTLVSGMLAPTVSDCAGGGILRAHIGDVHLDAKAVVFGDEIPFEGWMSIVTTVEIAPTEGGVSLAISGIERVETELTVKNDDDIAKEASLADIVESKLVDGLIGQLGDGLGSFDIPTIDLSTTLGQPPGTAVVEVTVEEVSRIDGATLLSGHL